VPRASRASPQASYQSLIGCKQKTWISLGRGGYMRRDPRVGEHQPYIFCVTSPFSARVRRIFCVAVFGTAPFRFEETSTAPNGRFIWRIDLQSVCRDSLVVIRTRLRYCKTVSSASQGGQACWEYFRMLCYLLGPSGSRLSFLLSFQRSC
jgi:hypothetical protein